MVLTPSKRDAELEVDAAAAVRALEELRACLVLQGQQVGQCLDDRDLCAERPPDARELDADHAAAEHDDGRRYPVEAQRVLAGDDPVAVDLETGQRPGCGAGRQQDVPALVPLPGDLDRRRGDQPALALDVGDLVRLHQALKTLVEAVDDAVLVGVHGRNVDAVERRFDADRCTVARAVSDLGRVQQRLGRNAAAMQAGAADLVLFDQCDR